jgi:hypothetical protein
MEIRLLGSLILMPKSLVFAWFVRDWVSRSEGLYFKWSSRRSPLTREASPKRQEPRNVKTETQHSEKTAQSRTIGSASSPLPTPLARNRAWQPKKPQKIPTVFHLIEPEREKRLNDALRVMNWITWRRYLTDTPRSLTRGFESISKNNTSFKFSFSSDFFFDRPKRVWESSEFQVAQLWPSADQTEKNKSHLTTIKRQLSCDFYVRYRALFCLLRPMGL